MENETIIDSKTSSQTQSFSENSGGNGNTEGTAELLEEETRESSSKTPPAAAPGNIAPENNNNTSNTEQQQPQQPLPPADATQTPEVSPENNNNTSNTEQQQPQQPLPPADAAQTPGAPPAATKELKISYSVRKDFVDKKITEYAPKNTEENGEENKNKDAKNSEKTNCISVMINIFYILGKNEEFIEAFVERIGTIAATKNNNRRNLKIEELKNIIGEDEDFNKKTEPTNKENCEFFGQCKKYIEDNIDEAVSICREFKKITGKNNCLNFEVLNCISNIELFQDTHPNKRDRELMNKLVNEIYRVSGRSLRVNESIEDNRKKIEKTKQKNKSIINRNFEMTESTLGVGAVASAVAFPPLLVIAAIIYLLYVNNKRVEGFFSKIEGKKNNWLNKLQNESLENISKKAGEITSQAMKRRDEKMKSLENSIPLGMKPFAKDLISPSANKVSEAIREYQNLLNCNEEFGKLLSSSQKCNSI
ncbi:MAG: hypothetical protein LBI70_02315 [Rickettsiales bacterium]|nr:hypothetical protein [Rickettsiales bacterium]